MSVSAWAIRMAECGGQYLTVATGGLCAAVVSHAILGELVSVPCWTPTDAISSRFAWCR